jgi:drug/metabolite transporter (DMT)-like permease
VTGSDFRTVELIAVKSLLVGGSWIFGYYAMRALPISSMSPIRASAPFWTLIGAIAFFGERPNAWQAVGMAAILAGYAGFSIVGRSEGMPFTRHAGVWLAFAATLTGAASALFDKFLLQACRIPRTVVQFWFCVALMIVLGALLAIQRFMGLHRTPFRWRWSIPAVGLLLVAADWLYFRALSEPGVPISVVSLIRRSNVVLAFAGGFLLFGDSNFRAKTGALMAILAGVAILCLAR